MARVACWDADFIPFYVCHNKRYTTGILREKTLDDCIELCDSLIANINKAVRADSFVGYVTRGKCFRYIVYPDYKGNRKYDNMPKYLNEVRAYMIDKYGFKGLEGYEADDAVVSYKRRSEDDVIIISPDKDLLNIEGMHFNPKKFEYTTTSKEDAEKYFWTSMLVGDTADNIKGCKGIGPVTARVIIDSVIAISSLKGEVLERYCNIYGESNGVAEFYKNYKCLRIVDDIDKDLLDNVTLNKIEVLSE